MYCIKCGVELADTEKKCPLCQTRVYHPEVFQAPAQPLYPKGCYPAVKKSVLGLQGFISIAVVLPILIVLLCDLQGNGMVSWSGFVIGGILTGYVTLVLPMWFQKPNPVIFVPCAFAAAVLYLLYIDLVTGGEWFLSFAFPVAGGLGLIVTAAVTLQRYLKRGRLYIVGGTCIALGGLLLLTEFLLNLTFHICRFVGWSLYPLTVLALLGGFLIFLAICRPAREMMERKFFF